MIEPKFMSFLFPGLIYGLITGIALAVGIICGYIAKRNLVSENKAKIIPKYARNGLEIFNSNMSDNFDIGGYNGSKKKKSGIGYIDREDEDNLEYFKRNLDLNYKPVKKKLDLDRINKRQVNRRKFSGNVKTESINAGVKAAAESAAKVAEDIKAAETESSES